MFNSRLSVLCSMQNYTSRILLLFAIVQVFYRLSCSGRHSPIAQNTGRRKKCENRASINVLYYQRNDLVCYYHLSGINLTRARAEQRTTNCESKSIETCNNKNNWTYANGARGYTTGDLNLNWQYRSQKMVNFVCKVSFSLLISKSLMNVLVDIQRRDSDAHSDGRLEPKDIRKSKVLSVANRSPCPACPWSSDASARSSIYGCQKISSIEKLCMLKCMLLVWASM